MDILIPDIGKLYTEMRSIQHNSLTKIPFATVRHTHSINRIFKTDIFIPDIDECDADNGDCDHLCENTDGSYTCSCRDGYSLGNDDHSCIGKEELYMLSSSQTNHIVSN